MADTLPLSLDELLTTTRSVRRRLDFSRPVPRQLVEECIDIALQAPTPSNLQNWHFILVTEPDKKMALADLYRKGREIYVTLPSATANLDIGDDKRNATQQRIEESAQYLNQHFQQAPVLVIPCIEGRTDQLQEDMTPGWGEVPKTLLQSAQWGSIAPATWSFMLAARARGLGTCWTSLHLYFEEQAAKILGIPYADVMQACMLPLAYTKGVDFKPGAREPLTKVIHWDSW